MSYALDFMPPPLFPRYLAMMLLQTDFHIEVMEPLRHNMLRAKLSTTEGPAAFMIALQGDGEEGPEICLASTNAMVLRSMCCSLERLIGRDFVAVACSTTVEFESAKERGRFSWDVDNEDGETLGSLLENKKWDERIVAENVTKPRHRPLFSLGGVFGISSAAYFVSHCSGNRWVHFDILDGLVSKIENMTGERVWFDKYELVGKHDFHALMEDGVRRARCVVVCLSRSYLASQNCLLELKFAREQNMSKGTRIVLIAMEREVVYEAIKGWESGVDVEFRGVDGTERVHRHTVEWVKEHLLGIGVNINTEWAEGGAAWSEQRDAALRKIVNDASTPAAIQATGVAPKFRVERCSKGGYFLRDEALPDIGPGEGERRAPKRAAEDGRGGEEKKEQEK